MLDKKQIVDICNNYFYNSEVDFVFLFGSIANGRPNQLSDIDLAIHYIQKPCLSIIGAEIYNLEKLFKRDIDLIILNDLYKTKPGFVFDIVSSGILVLNKNNEKLINYRAACYTYYHDTQYLRNQVNNALMKRIASGKFAVKG